MEDLHIQATKYTPTIELNNTDGIINISGKSYPENTFDFYRPVLQWVEEYFQKTNNEKTTVNLDLEYLNSSSLKAYFDFFDILDAAHEKGNSLDIKWTYDEDNDISEETGEDFIEDFEKLNIQLISK